MKTKLLSLVTVGFFSFFINTVMVSATSFTGSFSDVKSTHPNFEAIEALKTKGIISGYPDLTFRPDQVVTRVEALKIILLGSSIEAPEKQGNGGLLDIQQEWYTRFVLKALELNIVQGYADKTFKPSQTVNLVESLKMLILTNGIDLNNLEVTETPYKDAESSEWYIKYLQYAKDKNLIDADVRGNIFPGQGITRGKLAEIMYRLIKVKEQGQENPTPKQEDNTTVDDNALKVSIIDFAFKKSEMTIPLGTTVRWTNNDNATHTVTSDNGKFDSGNLAQDATFTYTFNKTGTFNYHCELHPDMKGTIIVKGVNEVPTI